MSTILESHQAEPDWYSAIPKYSQPNAQKATWQLLNTFLPYIALWGLMVHAAQSGYAYWTILALSVLAAAFLVRIFALFHDCCHNSLFASHRANRTIGYASGIITFTPYDDWRSSHMNHHMTFGDLDRRGTGSVWMMTLDEYLSASRLTRLKYRIYRNPFVMFGLGPAYMFLLRNRFFHKGAKPPERNSVILTNLSILGIAVVASLTIGFHTYLIIQLPVILIAGTIGLWLFYVQHQFDGVYWARHDRWDRTRAALEGASYYKLPNVLRWFTGNIGLHHVHHIRPTIPNYNLQRCYDELVAFQEVRPLTVRKSVACLRMNLWDERNEKMVSFRSTKRQHR